MGEIEITKVEATGRVFNLKKLEDFNGSYAAVGAEGTIALGAGETAMKNNKGVVIYVSPLTKGVNSKLAAGESCNCLWPSFSPRYYYPYQAPVIVIFPGVMGRFMHSGFTGLFAGASMTSIGHKFFVAWIDAVPEAEHHGESNKLALPEVVTDE